MTGFAGFVRRRSTAILVVAAIVSAALGLAALRLRVNPTLERLRSVTPGALLEQEIGRAFGLPSDVHVVIATGRDLQSMLRENEALVSQLREAAPDMSVHAPTTLLPSDAAQAHRVERIRRELPRPSTMLDALP